MMTVLSIEPSRFLIVFRNGRESPLSHATRERPVARSWLDSLTTEQALSFH